MRFSVWDEPRVIDCAENYPNHIALPRGCLDAALELLRDNAIGCELIDERYAGSPLEVAFAGTLRLDQEFAVAAMLHHDAGVLCAPTAFGKTVTAAAMIARRGVNTLVLVHRTELLKQWQERLQSFLDVGKGVVGTIGGGKAKPTGKIDIAVMQSLSRQGEVNRQVENYGHVIVDECHHVGAVSFDAILKQAKARYGLGLTATPIRGDGQQPITFMQCGAIRHTAAKPTGAPHDLATRCRPMPRVFCWRPASWWGKDSTIHRSTLWCWECRYRGKERRSNTRADYTENTPPRPMCASSTSWMPVTRRTTTTTTPYKGRQGHAPGGPFFRQFPKQAGGRLG